jgi:cytoskeletal protein RodZ
MDANKVPDASPTVARDEIKEENINSKAPEESGAKDRPVENVPPPQDVATSSDGDKSLPKDTTTVVESSNVLQPTATATSAPQKDYSSFTLWEKRFIVFAATMGAFFSPFTAQIYFPALNTIAKDLHVSPSKINLTMTTYMVCFFLSSLKGCV